MESHQSSTYGQVPDAKIAEFANSVDLDEVAHLDLHCLPSSV